MNIRLDLIRRFQRPVIRVGVGGVEHLALLDTGAQVPVYVGGSQFLMRIGGKLIGKDRSFSGFGGRCSGDIYKIDLDMGGFMFRDLPVMQTTTIDMPFKFILSAPMFSGFSYLIDDRQKILTVNTHDASSSRHIRVIDKDGHIHVFADTRMAIDDGA